MTQLTLESEPGHVITIRNTDHGATWLWCSGACPWRTMLGVAPTLGQAVEAANAHLRGDPTPINDELDTEHWDDEPPLDNPLYAKWRQ